MFAPPDADAEEARRIAAAVAQADGLLCARLFAASARGSYERAILSSEPSTWGDFERELLARMAWHYRARLPGHLRPRMNRADPIARERVINHG